MLPSLVLSELLENPFFFLPLANLLATVISGSQRRQWRIINAAVGYKTQSSQFWLRWLSQPHGGARSWVLSSSSSSVVGLQATPLLLP